MKTKMTTAKFLNFSKHLRGNRCFHTRIILSAKPTVALEKTCHHGQRSFLLRHSVGHQSLVSRHFHTTLGLHKKKNTFKPEDIEIVNVFDPSGEFIWAGERLVVNKFCKKFHRFSFDDVGKFDPKQPAQFVEGAKNVQLKDKKKASPVECVQGENTAKDIKEIKIGRNQEDEVKFHKIVEVLINHGEVYVTHSKKTKELTPMKQFVEKFGDFVDNQEGMVIAKPVTAEMLSSIFTDIHQEEQRYINNLKEMIKVIH